ncbi:cation:proton antiporter [Furfurilactobacillus siliginis]|uniref:NhaP-type Na+ H+ and K+ H+ antiporter n=1 Tax=Furfurilactobacillus siliginis TaxID=348151 RepID=A0A0R2L4R0_9LACO|nr:sodium:proton antiporter [Furfurilactobacillus siliginis]KRN96659.1 NhaP-type Na+ H+ and K+ H+ antiporter [Furfurilactobacillus siliginis]GEK29357.1 sodium:proton antiporter [Furfurilactobacillus siliginis]
MNIIEAVIILVVLVLLSNVLSHFLTAVPVSLIQVTLGLLWSLIFHITIPLETNWFLLLFIAPLLFNDGRRFPKRELWTLRGPIMANAVLLVFLTTVLGGWLFHLLIPGLPLAVGFALAAILSPTDPIAVTSIAEQVELPPAIIHLVSGESLINDASGLIGFKYALAAAVTGTFSLWSATGDFLYTSLIGFVIGFVGMTALQMLREVLRRSGINDPVFNTVLQLMSPFVIYLGAEAVHASGVIAVVTAGVLAHVSENRVVEDLPEQRLLVERTWDIIVYILNGIVFVILGDELPHATRETIADPATGTLGAIGYVVVIWLILFVLRAGWIYVYARIGRLWGKWRGHVTTGKPVTVATAIISGLTGVRGAITLAGVLTIPATVQSGAAFPERSLILFIAAGVIVMSLVIAAVTLPLVNNQNAVLLTRGSQVDSLEELTADEDMTDEQAKMLMSNDEAKVYLSRTAVRTLESLRRAENQRAAYDLILDYQFIIRRLQMRTRPSAEVQHMIDFERQLRQVALEGELAQLEELHADGKTSSWNFRYYQRQIKQRLASNESRQRRDSLPAWRTARRLFRHGLRRVRILLTGNDMAGFKQERSLIERETAKAAIRRLSKFFKAHEVRKQVQQRQSIYHLIVHYRYRIERRTPAVSPDPRHHKYDENLRELRVRALAAERTAVMELQDAGRITPTMAANLRQYVNYSENVLMLGEDLQTEATR